MKPVRLDRLPWIDVPPYDQVLTNLVSSCQKRDTNLICVQGSNGAGKSRILTELLSSLSFDATASLIALSGRDNEVFYHNVQVSSELLSLNDPEFLDHFILTLEAILQDKQHFYILIDDVEALSYELLNGMVQIIVDNPAFHEQVTLIVFMGVAPIHIETQKLFEKAEVIALTPMSVMQVKSFVDSVYQHIRHDKEISISDVNQLHSMSYGYIGRVIKLLEEDKQLCPEPPTQKYRAWLMLMVIAAAFLAFIVWFWPKSSPDEVETIIADTSTAQSLNNKVQSVDAIEVPVKIVEQQPNVITVAPIKEMEPVAAVKVVLPVEIEPEIELPIVIESPLIEKTMIEKQKPVHIKKSVPAVNYVIELGQHANKIELENLLKGRSIPGQPQYQQINQKGAKVWVAFIGPYGSEKQAAEGKVKLPMSLQKLPLKVRKEY